MLLKDINHNDCDSIQNLIDMSRKYIEDNKVPAGKIGLEAEAGIMISLRMNHGL